MIPSKEQKERAKYWEDYVNDNPVDEEAEDLMFRQELELKSVEDGVELQKRLDESSVKRDFKDVILEVRKKHKEMVK